jgi:hypothetical protein
MSGLREHSVWFMTPFEDENGAVVNAASIRSNLVSRHSPCLTSPTESIIRVILPNYITNPLAWPQGGLKPFQALIRR